MRTAKAFSNENAESEKFLRANERFKVSKKDRYKAMARLMVSPGLTRRDTWWSTSVSSRS